MEMISTDVLVIGGGLAASAAAIEASKYGASVTLIDKGRFGRSGSTPTSGGSPHAYVPVEMGGDPEDSPQVFIRDNVEGGEYLCDQEMLGILASQGMARIVDLERFGVPFEKENGRFKTSRTMGESYPRVGRVIGDGRALMDGLRAEVLKRGVRVLENMAVIHLLKDEGRVRGALAIRRQNGEPLLLEARAVILSAGGTTGIYGQSSANFLVSGDSYGLALRAGAGLKNMEFQEFTLVPAPFGRPIATAAIKGITAAGAKFYNEQGERFLEKYDAELMELSLRSRLTVAVAREYAQGRQALLDATFLEKPVSHLPKVERAGFNWRRDRIPYVVAIHDSLGGIITDSEGRSEVPGLYAAGEAAGLQGTFGADRAGGAILACLVFGHRAGAACGAELAGKERGTPCGRDAITGEAERYFEGLKDRARGGGAEPGALKAEVRRLSDNCIGVIRNGDGLLHFLKEGTRLFDLSRRLPWKDPPAMIEAIEASSMVLTGLAIAASALERQESRGHHFREDRPKRDDAKELRWIVVRGGDPQGIQVTSSPVPFDRYSLKPPTRKGDGSRSAGEPSG